ncbi:MAG TPA: succinate--CoA ligase subunit alpha [Anaerolineaceae bacterium]|nr:succinate--CoA ligase subunit alpha [Anaerolineaceae bacterium]HOV06944.1 succinate--CoA ligase subunit alpha [Anaerolineaceae bacterium]
MSILVNNKIRLVVQGITGNEGLFHSQQMLFHNTNIVAGVSPGKGGDWVLDGKIPVFDTVKNAVEVSDANASVIFVPAKYAADAIFEAVDAGLELVVCITEGMPVLDMMKVKEYLRTRKTKLIGPNCPGILVPGEVKVGIIPGNISMPGNIGVVSRSGTLTYEILYSLYKAGKGVSTCVGIGGDPIKGLGFVDILELFEADAKTDAVILIGEIGGNDEELAAEFISRQMTKPVAAFIAGKSAPPGKRMGHAGAIIEGSSGTAAEKIALLQSVGVKVADYPEQLAEMI